MSDEVVCTGVFKGLRISAKHRGQFVVIHNGKVISAVGGKWEMSWTAAEPGYPVAMHVPTKAEERVTYHG